MIKQNRYYIIDISDILKFFHYSKGFLTKGGAKEAIDRNLPKGFYSIVTGKALRLMQLPSKRTPFKVHSPDIYRKQNGPIQIHTKLRRTRNRKNNIDPKKFKALWSSKNRLA